MAQYQSNFIIGSCYKDIPQHPYEWIWSDGPHIFYRTDLQIQPDIPTWENGKTHLVPNMDAFRVVQQSDVPVTIFIDFRRSTQLAYSILFGPQKVKHYSDWSDLGVIENVTQEDIIFGVQKPLIQNYSDFYEMLVDVKRGENPHWI